MKRNHKEKPCGKAIGRPGGETTRSYLTKYHEERPQEVASQSTLQSDPRKRTHGETMRRGLDGEKALPQTTYIGEAQRPS